CLHWEGAEEKLPPPRLPAFSHDCCDSPSLKFENPERRVFMKFSTLIAIVGIALIVGCRGNPHKAEKIETEIENVDVVSGDTSVGVKDGNMVVQKKVQM